MLGRTVSPASVTRVVRLHVAPPLNSAAPGRLQALRRRRSARISPACHWLRPCRSPESACSLSHKCRTGCDLKTKTLFPWPGGKTRLQGVVIEQLHWQRCIEKYDRPKTLFLLDPP